MISRRFFSFLGKIIFLLVVCLVNSGHARVHHQVFLPNTDHELNVYRIFGEEPGKTIMIIGGIQGDEPGGYLTADLYADVNLKKGNLIVVPRANFYSILLNQREGLTGDMNRKFGGAEKRTTSDLEDEIVAILKHLIAESDCLLNLHEGSGFYAPHWVSDMENPRRYGQSIIFDAPVFKKPDSNQIIYLKDLAGKVIDKVNSQIDNERYRFRVNNHDTLSEASLHLEQRRSATYYALTKGHIPAFGIETSKSIKSLEDKVHMHKLVINGFMEEFGIILDAPGIKVEEPKMDYLIIKVNDGHAFALPDTAALPLEIGDEVTITDVIANYKRGLAVDIRGWGTANDTNLPFRVSKPTRVLVRKDAKMCGWVDLLPEATGSPKEKRPSRPQEKLRAEQFLVNVENVLKTITAGQTLTAPKGVRLTLQGVRTNLAHVDNDVAVNFKGFTPPKQVNDGNDLHFPVYTDKDLLIRYSENKQGRRYPVEANYHDKIIGKFWVEITE